MYEGDDMNPRSVPPGEASNRTFSIAAGILGGIVLLSIVCLAVYALFILPNQRNAQNAQQATVIAQPTEVAQALTQTAAAVVPSPLPSDTPMPSPTPVVAQPTATLAQPTPNAATATVAYALTQAAIAAQTSILTSTALPGTGFADEVGVPGLVGMAVLLVVVILVARRLRISPKTG